MPEMADMNHPAKRFAIAAAVLLVLTPLISRVMNSAGDVDLTLHGTYYVLPRALICLMMAALLAVFAAAYSIFSFRPRPATWHFWPTVASIVLFWLAFFLWGTLAGERLGTQALTNPSTPPLETAIAVAFVLSTLLLLLSPAILVMNLALEWARIHRRRTA
jgi:heme/copper-type cytochrome/quinol oxidase subunit 1